MRPVTQGRAAASRQLFVPSAPTVVLGRREQWCRRCGESVNSGDVCPRCSCRETVDPKQVLQPQEYVVL